jgi:acyl dehydratase
MISREHIGRTSAPLTLEVEKGHIRRFAEAIGDASPIYHDEAAARAAGHPRIPTPPTFAVALRPNDAREGLGIDWANVLHGEQELEHVRPLYAGDVVTVVQTIKDIYEKQGKSGAMDFLVLETTGRRPPSIEERGDRPQAGELVFVVRATIVVKR